MPTPNTSNQTGSSTDPRRPNKIFRYKPLANKPTDDPTPDYMNLLGMIFSMCGLMMKVRCGLILANDSSFCLLSLYKKREFLLKVTYYIFLDRFFSFYLLKLRFSSENV